MVALRGKGAAILRGRSPAVLRPREGTFENIPLAFDRKHVVQNASKTRTDVSASSLGLPDNTLVDMRGKSLSYDNFLSPKINHALFVTPGGRANLYFLGGYVWRDSSESINWTESYQGSGSSATNAGMIVRGDGSVGTVIFDGVRLHNTHDGLMISNAGELDRVIVLKNCYATHIFDDFCQNPPWHSMIYQGNLIDGCGLFYAERLNSEKLGEDHKRLILFRDNLVRLKPIPRWGHRDGYSGHGGFTKIQTQGTPTHRAPDHVWLNNVLWVTGPSGGLFNQADLKDHYAEGNLVIWPHNTSWPYAPVPPGFTLLAGNEGVQEWNRRKAAWLAEHGWDDATRGGTANGGSVTKPNRLPAPHADRILCAGGSRVNLACGSGIDILIGSGAANVLTGDNRDNYIFAGFGTAGPNVLRSGTAGRNFLVGTQDAMNRFVIQNTDGKYTTVLGFNPSRDEIEINGAIDVKAYQAGAQSDFIRFSGDANTPQTGSWLEVRPNGAGSWIKLAWVARAHGNSGPTPASIASRLRVTPSL